MITRGAGKAVSARTARRMAIRAVVDAMRALDAANRKGDKGPIGAREADLIHAARKLAALEP